MAADLNGQWSKTTEALKDLKTRINESDGFDKPALELLQLLLENQLAIIQKLREMR